MQFFGTYIYWRDWVKIRRFVTWKPAFAQTDVKGCLVSGNKTQGQWVPFSVTSSCLSLTPSLSPSVSLAGDQGHNWNIIYWIGNVEVNVAKIPFLQSDSGCNEALLTRCWWLCRGDGCLWRNVKHLPPHSLVPSLRSFSIFPWIVQPLWQKYKKFFFFAQKNHIAPRTFNRLKVYLHVRGGECRL